MNTTRTFEHDNKKYEISYDRKTGNCVHKFDFELEEPFTAKTQVSKPTHEDQEKLMFAEELNGFDGIGVKKEAITWMRKVAEKKEKEEAEIPVWTFQGDFGEKRVKTENKEDAVEYFNKRYNADLTKQDVEKQEKETTENTEEVEETQETNVETEKEEKDETVCSAKGCGKRKDRNDTYCQFHQELKAEAQNTSKDATPAHPTGGRY